MKTLLIGCVRFTKLRLALGLVAVVGIYPLVQPILSKLLKHTVLGVEHG